MALVVAAGGFPLRPIALALVPLALVLATVPAAAAPLYAHTVDGPASFAARIDTGADGAFRVTLTSCGTKTASTDGVAILLFDGAKAFRFGVGVTGHGSPDRTIAQLGDAGSASVSYPSYGPICPYSSMTMTVGGAPSARHHVVAWGAGLSGATSLRIEAAPDATAVVNIGTATALGDPELERGAANAQVQRRVSGFQGLGVKVVKDAAIELAVAEQAFGFWGFNDAKFVCANVCAGPALANEACRLAAGTTCGTRLSWSGPAGGGAGSATQTLFAQPAGAYTFVVEHKVDAYNPGGGAFVPPGVLIFPGENYSYLSLADVRIP